VGGGRESLIGDYPFGSPVPNLELLAYSGDIELPQLVID
jgi:hypothetical protein